MMKQICTRILLTLIMCLVGVNAIAYAAYDFYANGIYYNYINDGKELEVTYRDEINGFVTSNYSGDIVIPEEVTYMNRTRKVTSIGYEAFYDCSQLTSVNIPNSVKTIGSYSFWKCNNLISVSIPDNVTTIGESAFEYCGSLKSLNFPPGITVINNNICRGCRSLTTLIIPDGVITIGANAFGGCTGLTSLTIPNSVSNIGNCAFMKCSGLTSLNIGNSVISIGYEAFRECSRLTTVVIPNSVTSINRNAFYDCNRLTSLTIGKNVTEIGSSAFYGENITTIISLIEDPFVISQETFNQNTFKNATLYVPAGTIDKYKSTEGWKNFLFIEEGTGDNTPTETYKCSTPTISYKNGKLTFICDTEGAVCQYSITNDDIKYGTSNEVQLGVTYNISVYAAKSGYQNSESVNATLCWIDVDPKTEGIDNSITTVRAKAVLIQSNGSTLTISGAEAGMIINVYDTVGRLVGSTNASTGTTSVSTMLQCGEIGIVKIGEKVVKVLIK